MSLYYYYYYYYYYFYYYYYYYQHYYYYYYHYYYHHNSTTSIATTITNTTTTTTVTIIIITITISTSSTTYYYRYHLPYRYVLPPFPFNSNCMYTTTAIVLPTITRSIQLPPIPLIQWCHLYCVDIFQGMIAKQDYHSPWVAYGKEEDEKGREVYRILAAFDPYTPPDPSLLSSLFTKQQ